MNFWQNLLYGIVSGITEFTPVSSGGHQVLMRKLFGVSQANPLLDLLVHLGLLMAVFASCRSVLLGYVGHLRAGRIHRSRRSAESARRTYDLRFLIPASVAMLLLLVFRDFGNRLVNDTLILCLFFLANGLVLYVVDHLPHGNKDSSRMSALDSILTGVLSGMSVLPGISRLGMSLSVAVGRGADKVHAYGWALSLCVPALILFIFLDLLGVITVAGISYSFVSLVGYVFAAVGAFAGGYLIIMLMRFMLVNTGFSGYALYCWGVSILTFILYLIA